MRVIVFLLIGLVIVVCFYGHKAEMICRTSLDSRACEDARSLLTQHRNLGLPVTH